MGAFPALSSGALFAPTSRGGVVYDLHSEELSFLNPTAAALCAACAAGTTRGDAIAAWAGVSGAPVARVEADVDVALAGFSARGWIGGTTTPRIFLPHAPVTPLAPGETHASQSAGVHDIRFRSLDRSLVDDVVGVLGLPAGPAEPTSDFHLIRRDDGGVTLRTDSEWPFPHRGELSDRIIAVVNDFVARTTTEAVLHAAAACSPGGAAVVLPSPAGNGKSTLVAGLVQRGWAYLTDESVTIRREDLTVLGYPKPLELDAASRVALGLAPSGRPIASPAELGGPVRVGTSPAPPPSAIVLCTYVGGTGRATSTTLDPDDALVELVRNTLNLRYVGVRGLETLVALSEHVPVHRISYRSGAGAFRQLDSLGLR